MADLYCTRADVNGWLPAGEIAGKAGIVASCSASSDVFERDGHGLETDAQVKVRALEGGTLPAPLVDGTIYYVIRLTGSSFQLASDPGGSPINITSDASDFVVAQEPDFDSVIEFWSRWADVFLPAHAVPLEAPIHPVVKGTVAQLSAKSMLNIDGKSSLVVDELMKSAKATLEKFGAGLPLRPESPGASIPATNLAVRSNLNSSPDPRGWGGQGELP